MPDLNSEVGQLAEQIDEILQDTSHSAALPDDQVQNLNTVFNLAADEQPLADAPGAPLPTDRDPSTAATFDPEALNQLFGLNGASAQTASSHKAFDIEPHLRNKCVVLTGRPPEGYTKATFAAKLRTEYHVSMVEPRFSSRTQLVISDEREIDTKKRAAAKAAGIEVLFYDDIP